MRGGSNVLVSPDEAAQQLGVSRDTVDRHWEEWGWRRHQVGRLVRFAQRDIDNFISRVAA